VAAEADVAASQVNEAIIPVRISFVKFMKTPIVFLEADGPTVEMPVRLSMIRKRAISIAHKG
jgi:hypothetical protein